MARTLHALTALLLITLSFASKAQTEYRFGVIPQFEPDHLVTIWTPIMAELERRTGFAFSLSTEPEIPRFELDIREGRFDFAYLNPYQFITEMDAQGYEPLVRDGGRSLTGILVVPAQSPIQSVAELDGKKVAFPSPRALAASLLMRADLAEIHRIEVQPVFVRSHSNVYDSVLLGYASAGGGVMSTLMQQGPRAPEVLRVLYKTREIPPHPVVAHRRVPAKDREAVRRALLEMAATEEGAALLARIPMVRAVAATREDYRPLHEWDLQRYFGDSL